MIFELLKAVNALGNVLFITNIQIFLWQKQILLQILKKILEKNWLWGEKVFCCGGKLFLNSSLKHLWEKITSAKHISFALRLARNEQKIWYHYLWSCFLFCYHWTLFSALCSFLMIDIWKRKRIIWRYLLHIGLLWQKYYVDFFSLHNITALHTKFRACQNPIHVICKQLRKLLTKYTEQNISF